MVTKGIKYVFVVIASLVLSAVIYKFRLELLFAVASLLVVGVRESIDLVNKVKV